MVRKAFFMAILAALPTSAAIADSIKLPGVTIDENGIKAPGVVIDDEGISAPGVEIDDEGIAAPGVRIETGEAGLQERIRIRESRRPGQYDDDFFTAEGKLRRDEFVGMDLRGYDFSGYHLERVKFIDTDLEGASFHGAVLERVEFDHVNLEGADFSDTILERVDFQESMLGGACFIYSTMQRTDFEDSDLTDTVWIAVQAERTDFKNSDRGGLITHGWSSCHSYHGSVAPSATIQIAAPRPEVTKASVIEATLSEGADASVDLTVNFAHDSDQIEGGARAQIMEIAQALNAPSLAQKRVRIEGHTDSDGEEAYNLDLSYRRAIAVTRMLIDDYNIASDRFEVEGAGEDDPVATNENDEGRALNRRVTLVNLGQL
jgi:outer membrane protein OmpA-like peptidoglycan-associated protein